MLLQHEHNYIRAEEVLFITVVAVIVIIIIISNIFIVIIIVCFLPQIKELIHRVDEAKAKEKQVLSLAKASAFSLGTQKDDVVHGNMFYLLLVCNALLLQWSLHDTVQKTHQGSGTTARTYYSHRSIMGLVWQERVTIAELGPGKSWYSKH